MFRKLLAATVLALALICGMAATAFAASTGGVSLITVGDSYLLENIEGKVDPDLSVTYIAGKTLYYQVDEVTVLPAASGAKPATKAIAKPSEVKRNYTLDYSSHGSAVPMSVSLVSRGDASGDTRTYIAVRLRDSFRNTDTPKALDLEITLTARDGAKILEEQGGAYVQTDSFHIQLSEDVTYGEQKDIGNGPLSVDDTAIFSFSGDADNVTLCFDKSVEVSGNMRGLRDKFLRLSVRDDDLEQQYPGAILRLFDGPESSRTFSRQVAVLIPVRAIEDSNGKPVAPYLYEERNGVLKTVDAEYNIQDELFSIKTRTLGRYLISDEQLLAEESASASSDASAPQAAIPVKPPLAQQPPSGSSSSQSSAPASSQSSAPEAPVSSSSDSSETSQIEESTAADAGGTGEKSEIPRKGRPIRKKNRRPV